MLQLLKCATLYYRRSAVTAFLFALLISSIGCLASEAETIRLAESLEATFELKQGWRSGGAGCVISPGGNKFCVESTPATEMGACSRIEAEARFKDAPGDPDIRITELARSDGDSARGFTQMCAATVFSPGLNSYFLRAVVINAPATVLIRSEYFRWDSRTEGDRTTAARDEFLSFLDLISIETKERRPEPAEKTAGADAAQRRPDFQSIKAAAEAYAPRQRPEPLLDADYLKLTGRFEAAKTGYASLAEKFPYDSAVGLGDAALAVMDLYTARAEYNRATDIDPLRADAFNGLGAAELLSGNAAAAESFFTRADMIEPDNPGTFVNLGWLKLTQGRFDDAERCFMEALARSPDPDAAAAATNGLTETAFHFDEPAAAAAWNSEFLKRFPDYAESHANLIRAYLALGDTGAAAREADTLLELRPDQPAARLLAGRAYMVAGRFADAEKTLCTKADFGQSGRLIRKLCEEAKTKSGSALSPGDG